MDDYINRIMYLFLITANTFNINDVVLRSDQPSKIDLDIRYNDKYFSDTRSGIKFYHYLVDEKYY